MKIIEHSDYNAPINNENVARLNFYGKLGRQEHKAFKISEGIWIIPKCIAHDVDPRVESPNDISCYNPDYLSTYDERSDYLKKMTTIFKRIALNPLGGELLKYLKYSNPVLCDDVHKSYINKVEDVNGVKTTKKEQVACTLIIHGSKNLNSRNCYNILDDKDKEATFGKKSFITFCPDLLNNFNYVISDNILLMDPATSLFHEMVHSFHKAHYNNIVKKKDLGKKVGANAEEVITFGGTDSEVSQEEIKKLRLEVLGHRNNIINNLNRHIRNNQEYKKNIDYLLVKYNLQMDNFGDRIFTTDKLDKEYIYTMFDHFTEVNFCDKFNLPKRAYYAVISQRLPIVVDVNNPKKYTVENGLTKSLLKRGSGETVRIHKNSYLPENWQKEVAAPESTLRQLTYLNDNYPELFSRMMEKDMFDGKHVSQLIANYEKGDKDDKLGINVEIPTECTRLGASSSGLRSRRSVSRKDYFAKLDIW